MPEFSLRRASAGRTPGRLLHRFAVFTAGATLLLIAAGGLVTSTDSGLSVPDWPTSYGWNMFTFPVSRWVGGIRFEHVHRLIASTVGFLTILLAIGLARWEPRRWVRRLGYFALAAVVAQGLLGGLTVLLMLPPAVSIAHACLAQTFFCLVVAIAVVTSPRWKDASPESLRSAFRHDPVARITAVTVGAIFLQLLLGAVMRHTHAGLSIPDFPLAMGRLIPPLTSFPVAIHFAHRVGAVVVAVLMGVCLWRALRSGRHGLVKMAMSLAMLVSVQITLGGLTVLTHKSVIVTTAHVAVGALLLASTLALSLSSLAADRRRGNVVPIRSAVTRRAAGWR